jgi:rhamnose transport system ATP-binding protein
MLFGLERVESGTILLDGKTVLLGSPADAIARGIAYVPEDRLRHGIVADIPVAQNLTLSIWRRLVPGTWLRKGAERNTANEFIGRFSIKTASQGAAASTLSGGNQQKVVLARWLATNPGILILDEPTQGVDVGTKREVHSMIAALARTGVSVILISSDLPEILEVSDRIAVMREGRVVSVVNRGVSAEELMTAAVGSDIPGGAE